MARTYNIGGLVGEVALESGFLKRETGREMKGWKSRNDVNRVILASKNAARLFSFFIKNVKGKVYRGNKKNNKFLYLYFPKKLKKYDDQRIKKSVNLVEWLGWFYVIRINGLIWSEIS